MRKRKICVVTGTRAEYGLLYWLMKEINVDNALVLQVVVTGMHLSEEFGNTYQQIEKDGFTIDKKVDISLTSDTELAISKSMGLGVIGFADVFNKLQPDLIVVLGDRFEIFSAVSVALIAKIPVAHLHGGEVTEGVIDESIRHSITKMSHLHFAATDEYRNRIIQLGEQPDKVFHVGGLGIDNINKLKLLSKADFENTINFELGEKNILITFHPVTLEKSTSGMQFQALLDSISELKNTKIIFTKANADTDGRVINTMIDDYVAKHDNTIAFTSMGQLNYLSALQFIDAVVGNSSSGLIEAPSFKIGTIDIGDRQKGRIKTDSVISCLPKKRNIDSAFNKMYSEEFQNTLDQVENAYGKGGASKEIVNIIKSINLHNIIKKPFHDI
ncbi:UDP-N-acetylglucosamine 2-epimerase [Candidatus Thioglobus sp. NP1]|uniref:UDP-N-acetylglucosamine 2-epimerase n=1 Tax=Candidatus Thioglobus sp. NP1 TaxID=2508687 RepID=UPI000DED3901|nr:UDP-N-acetylglucosamine 2-epimerase [Candidatus Thioglobus sp. NP1]AXE61673.1 UDP-N-acetylglucosamine 2-epimerase (hydrolyzing) [Candidatus Thioglobus sp. NP1]